MFTLSFRFANKLWVDYLFPREIFWKTLLKLIVFSGLPWVVGLVISETADRLHIYIATPIFYFGSLGIFLTTGTLIYGSRNQYLMYDRFLSCYRIQDQDKREIVRNTLARHSDFFQHVRASISVFFVGVLFAFFSFLWWQNISGVTAYLDTYLPKFYAFEKYGWYDSSVAMESLYIAIFYVLFISFPLGTAGSIMLRLPVFLWKESSRQPKYPPILIKAHFAPATSFYARISVLWMMGVLLMLYLLGPNADWLSITIVVLLFALGAMNFAIPQIAYVRTVSESEDQFLDVISTKFEDSMIMEENSLGNTTTKFGPEAGNIVPIIQLIRHDDWVYPVHQTYIVVGIYVFSLYSYLFGWEYIISIVGSAVRN